MKLRETESYYHLGLETEVFREPLYRSYLCVGAYKSWHCSRSWLRQCSRHKLAQPLSKQVKSTLISRAIPLLTTTTSSAVVRAERVMEIRRHELRRSKTFSCFNGQLTDGVASMTHWHEGSPPPTSPPIHTLVRARSWAPLPFTDIKMSSSTSSTSLSSSYPSPEPTARRRR